MFAPWFAFFGNAAGNGVLYLIGPCYLLGLDAVDAIEARTAASTNGGKFTAEGVKADARDYALNNLVGPLHKARTAVAKAKTELAEMRGRLNIEQPDKSDIAAALLRQEIRAHLKSLPQADRDH